MNEQLTRVSLALAGSGQTDWDRVAALTDAEIDAAIAADTDCYALSELEVASSSTVAVSGGQASYVIRRMENGRFRWFLISAKGEILAASYEAAATVEEAQAGIMALRTAAIEAAPGAN